MKKIYGVVVSNKLTAIHDDEEVINNYAESISSEYDMKTSIVKLNRKKIEYSNEYQDLYLVRYGDTYIQSKYFSIARDDDSQFKYDLQYAYDVLLRVMEFNDNPKDIKHLRKSVIVIERELYKLDAVPKSPDTMKALLEMRLLFNNAMGK